MTRSNKTRAEPEQSAWNRKQITALLPLFQCRAAQKGSKQNTKFE